MLSPGKKTRKLYKIDLPNINNIVINFSLKNDNYY